VDEGDETLQLVFHSATREAPGGALPQPGFCGDHLHGQDLHAAKQITSASVERLLLRHDPGLLWARSSGGWTFLHEAVKNGLDLKVATLIHWRWPDSVKATTRNRTTPLHCVGKDTSLGCGAVPDRQMERIGQRQGRIQQPAAESRGRERGIAPGNPAPRRVPPGLSCTKSCSITPWTWGETDLATFTIGRIATFGLWCSTWSKCARRGFVMWTGPAVCRCTWRHLADKPRGPKCCDLAGAGAPPPTRACTGTRTGDCRCTLPCSPITCRGRALRLWPKRPVPFRADVSTVSGHAPDEHDVMLPIAPAVGRFMGIPSPRRPRLAPIPGTRKAPAPGPPRIRWRVPRCRRRSCRTDMARPMQGQGQGN
jgi:hypothetical protein